MPKRRRTLLRFILAAASLAAALSASGEGPEVAGARADSPTEFERDELAWRDDFRPAAERRDRLRVADLHVILHSLPDPNAEPPRSWLQRLMDWLQQRLALSASDGQMPGWLLSLDEYLTPERLTFAGWIGFVVLVVALIAVIVLELRAAGLGRPRRHAPTAPADNGARCGPEVPASILAPASNRPSQLLQYLISYLSARGVLPADASLTYGELEARLQAVHAPEASAFGVLRRAAEAELFGLAQPELMQMQSLSALLPASFHHMGRHEA